MKAAAIFPLSVRGNQHASEPPEENRSVFSFLSPRKATLGIWI